MVGATTCHQSSGDHTAQVGVFTAGQPRRFSTEEKGISEMRSLRKIHFLPKLRMSKLVVGQTNATGKMNSLLSFWVFGVGLVLVYMPAAEELV